MVGLWNVFAALFTNHNRRIPIYPCSYQLFFTHHHHGSNNSSPSIISIIAADRRYHFVHVPSGIYYVICFVLSLCSRLHRSRYAWWSCGDIVCFLRLYSSLASHSTIWMCDSRCWCHLACFEKCIQSMCQPKGWITYVPTVHDGSFSNGCPENVFSHVIITVFLHDFKWNCQISTNAPQYVFLT